GLLHCEVGKIGPDAYRYGTPVRIEKRYSVHSQRDISQDFAGNAVSRRYAKTLVDNFFGKCDQLLYHERHILGPYLGAKSCLGRQRRIDAIGQKNDFGAQVAVGPVRLHAGDSAGSVCEQIGHNGCTHYHGPFASGLIGKPTIEFSPSDRKGIVAVFLEEGRVPITEAESPFLAEIPESRFYYVAFNRTISLNEVGNYLPEVVSVENAA